MLVKVIPEGAKNVIPYDVIKNNLDLNDSEMIINLSRRERDYDVQLDICLDYMGGLVMGAEGGDRYVAQVVIPERSYTEVEVDNPNYNPDAEKEGTESSPTITERVPVPFSMDRCELTLWEMEG